MQHTLRTLASTLLLVGGLAACVDDPDAPLGDTADALSVWQWPDDTAITGKDSTRQVAMAQLGTRLHMIYTTYDSSTSTQLKWTRWAGTSWSVPVSVGLATDSRPALATYNDRLHLVFKPVGQGRLMMAVGDSSTFGAPVTVGRSLGSYVPSMPHLLAYGGKLYLSYCATSGSGSVVNVDRYDGTSWTTLLQQTVATNDQYRCASALMAPTPDTGEVELIYSVVESGTNTFYYSAVWRRRLVIGRSSTIIYSPEPLPMKSRKPLSVVTCNGATHLVHGGYSTETEIWWSFREGGDWVTDAKVPDQWSGAGAALGCYDDTQTLMVHNVSGGTQLMQSIFGP